MSQQRFAAITADLLARKGEARPWSEPAKTPLSWRPEPVAETKRISPTPQEWKKCTVRISQHDYERLGILAVKEGTTRHHLLQDAVAQFFTGMTRQFSGNCPCLGRSADKS